MDNKFNEPPPLPRYPTVIAGSMPKEEHPQNPPLGLAEAGNLAAPPRFPSLKDVGLQNAKEAAATLEDHAFEPAPPYALPTELSLMEDPTLSQPHPIPDSAPVPPPAPVTKPIVASEPKVDEQSLKPSDLAKRLEAATSGASAPPVFVPSEPKNVPEHVPAQKEPEPVPPKSYEPAEPDSTEPENTETPSAPFAPLSKVSPELPTTPPVVSAASSTKSPMTPSMQEQPAGERSFVRTPSLTGGVRMESSIGLELVQEIKETIERGAVEPGTGERRALAAASEKWTPSDQRKLEELLRERIGSLPSPGLNRDTLVTPSTAYPYSPKSPATPGGGIATRVAALNKAIKDGEGISPGLRAIPAQPVDPSSPPIDKIMARSSPNKANFSLSPTAGLGAGLRETEAPGSVVVDSAPYASPSRAQAPGPSSAEAAVSPVSVGITSRVSDVPRSDSRGRLARSGLDVKTGVFPPPLATVPMKMYAGPGKEPIAEPGDESPDSDVAARHEVMVRSKSTSAHVDITADYGLKGGHATGACDAGFFDHNTLVTGGADGKICIWNLEERYVECEFSPYNGRPINMLYPITEQDGSSSRSLITLSEDRLMRIWNLIGSQAVLLRSMQIPPSNNDLVMNVPVITPELKAHAVAAAAAAAVTTSEAAPESAPASFDANAYRAMQASAPELSKPAKPAEDTPKAQSPEQRVDSIDSTSETQEEGTMSPSGSERNRFSFVGDIFGGKRRSSSGKAKKPVAL